MDQYLMLLTKNNNIFLLVIKPLLRVAKGLYVTSDEGCVTHAKQLKDIRDL